MNDVKKLFLNNFTDKYNAGSTISFNDSRIGKLEITKSEDTPVVRALSYDDIINVTQQIW